MSPARNAAALSILSRNSLLSLGLGLERGGHNTRLIFINLSGRGLCSRSADGSGKGRNDDRSAARGSGRRNSLRLRRYVGSWQLAPRTARRQRIKLALRALTRRLSVDLGARSIALIHALVLLAHILRHAAGAADRRLIAEVRVDADEVGGQAVRADVLDDDFARRLGLVVCAVAAAAVQFACVDDGVVLDRHDACTVVLDYFIFGFLCAAAYDEGIACAEDGDGVFAYVAEPYVGQGAGSCETSDMD